MIYRAGNTGLNIQGNDDMTYSIPDIIGDVYGMARTTPDDAGHIVEQEDTRVTVWTDCTDIGVDVATDADGDAVIHVWHGQECTPFYSHADAVRMVSRIVFPPAIDADEARRMVVADYRATREWAEGMTDADIVADVRNTLCAPWQSAIGAYPLEDDGTRLYSAYLTVILAAL